MEGRGPVGWIVRPSSSVWTAFLSDHKLSVFQVTVPAGADDAFTFGPGRRLRIS